jgi:hypothetical protein
MIYLEYFKKPQQKYKKFLVSKKLRRIFDFLLGIIIAPLFYFLISLIIFFILTGQLKSKFLNQEIEQFILSKFSPEYDVKIVEERLNKFGEATIIVFAHDKRYYAFCEIDKPKVDLSPPILQIYEKRNDILTQLFPYIPPYSRVYEAKIEPQNVDSFFKNLFIYEKDIVDLDGNGEKEITLKVLTPPCGSGADVYNLVFGKRNGKYKLLESLPGIGYFEEIIRSGEEVNLINEKLSQKEKPKEFFKKTLLKLNKNEIKEIYYGDTDYFLEYYDFEGNGIRELVVAKMLWDIEEKECFDKNGWTGECECHFCPHYWLLGVYKYQNDGFIVDNKFNSGLLLKTEKKHDLFDIQGYKPIPGNILGSIGVYYGIGHFGQGKTILDFNYTSRNKSVIYDLVLKHYEK